MSQVIKNNDNKSINKYKQLHDGYNPGCLSTKYQLIFIKGANNYGGHHRLLIHNPDKHCCSILH